MASLIFLNFLLFLLIDFNEAVVVQTRYGSVRGVQVGNANVFYGIPYASPPGRWEDAEEPEPWQGILNATSGKPQCYQSPCVLPIGCKYEMSEDCLYLNIFAPLDAGVGTKKAVMVFIHGGSFTTGASDAPIYSAENLASIGDVIVVSINYRLGAFGFLVAGEGPDAIKGNYGIRDQRLALKWVKKNIKYFGGNRRRVTIFGQSAGAESVGIHMMTENSADLFEQAIFQSLPAGVLVKSRNAVERQGERVAEILGCETGDTKCLRAKPADHLVRALEAVGPGTNGVIDLFQPAGPFADGVDIKMNIIEAAQQGLFHKKPVLIGFTHDENIANVYDYYPSEKPLDILMYELRFWRKCGLKATSYQDLINQYQCPSAYAILSQYPPDNVMDTRKESSDFFSDFLYVCPIRNISTNIVSAGNAKTFVYIFNASVPIPDFIPVQQKCSEYACHSADLMYVFGSFDKFVALGVIPSADQLALSNQMIRYWSNFAKKRNPNGVGLARWPKFISDTDKQRYLILQTSGNFDTKNHKRRECDFWDILGYDERDYV